MQNPEHVRESGERMEETRQDSSGASEGVEGREQPVPPSREPPSRPDRSDEGRAALWRAVRAVVREQRRAPPLRPRRASADRPSRSPRSGYGPSMGWILMIIHTTISSVIRYMET